MLNVFYGRESIDKERFIFKSMQDNALLIVPDQFTLNAEKALLEYLKKDGIMDIEVVGMSRLGHKILAHEGGGKKPMIDVHGRHIIISKIVNKREKELKAFAKVTAQNSFVELLNDFISQMKQFNVSLGEIKDIISNHEDNPLLVQKLEDISLIYEEYEKSIEGRYVDSEDFINMFLPKIKHAKLIKDKDIWLWGFDWISPKVMEVILEMAIYANVNIVMTYAKNAADSQVFEVTENVIAALESLVRERGIEYCKSQIDDAFEISMNDDDVLNGKTGKNSALAALEKGLFTVPVKRASQEEIDLAKSGTVKLYCAANWHGEAENAVAYVLWLIREKGLRLKDIAIICNDLTKRGKLIERVFNESGIQLFVDQKRSILHHPAVAYIIALMDIMYKGFDTPLVLSMLKTGYCFVSDEDVEKLENYAIEYRIKRNAWKSPFEKGRDKYREQGMEHLEELRKLVIDPILEFEKEFKDSKSASSRTEALYKFLLDTAKIPEKLQDDVKELMADNLNEAALETLQIWNSIVSVLSQMNNVLGDEKISIDLYRNVLNAGFSAVQIGILPPTSDGLSMGTVQRSRLNDVKALVILGANEGLFPTGEQGKDLLSEREKKEIHDKGVDIGKLDELRSKEERLAIYKVFSAPRQYLYVSCSACDGEGKEQRPAMVWQDIKEFFDLEVETDIALSQDIESKLYSEGSTYRYLAEIITEAKNGKKVDDEWKEALSWCKENNPELTTKLIDAAFEKKGDESIDNEKIKLLYERNDAIKTSPSSLEKYSKCPFAHFVNYGLKAEERRLFGMGTREIGDICHQCIMLFSEELSKDGKEPMDAESKWQTITKEKCINILDGIFTAVTGKYNEGVANRDEEEKYISSRIRNVLLENCWALVNHVRVGKIEKMAYEEAFAKGAAIPAIEVKVGDDIVRIEGKIDRIDYMPNEGIKIIDYKSSNKKIKAEEVTYGWKLQLMLYLKAAITGEKKPVGVFYYGISDNEIDAGKLSKDKLKAKIEDLKNEYKMNGFLIETDSNIRNVLGDFSGYSTIVQGIRCSVDKETSQKEYSGDSLMKEAVFEELSKGFDMMIENLCTSLLSGNINVKPKKYKDEMACKYCLYGGICGFE